MRTAFTFVALAFAVHGATFYRDVLPVLEKHCQSCHRSGEIGPMPLLTYKQVRPWAKAIREAVLSHTMPPWFAAQASVRFANDPRLSTAEIDTIREWADGGVPEGNPADAPPPVKWPEGWTTGTPDLIVKMPEPVSVPASRELDYQYIILPVALKEDRWVHAVEIRPGARNVVHHAVAYVREKDDPWLRDAAPGKPFVRSGITRADILAVYAPGQPPAVSPAGMARKLPAGSDIVLQMHYTPNGRAVQDQTSVGITFAKQTPERRVITLQINATDFHIPPGDRDYHFSASGTLPGEALLLSLFPHMHLRGKAFEYSLVRPGGTYEPLLRVDPYRFEWQLSYVLEKPLPLLAGTRIRCTAWYDNSAGNPRNPDPAREVGYGEQSRDEMMVGFFDVAVPASMNKQRFFDQRQSPVKPSR